VFSKSCTKIWSMPQSIRSLCGGSAITLGSDGCQLWWHFESSKPECWQMLPQTQKSTRIVVQILNRPTYSHAYLAITPSSTLRLSRIACLALDASFIHLVQVRIISGKEKGQQGTVLRVFRDKNRVLIEGRNLVSWSLKRCLSNGLLIYSLIRCYRNSMSLELETNRKTT
jgi:hypothetical protein